MLTLQCLSLMLRSIRLATVAILATACLHPVLFAQTKGTPPPSPPRQPAPPPQPPPQRPPQPPPQPRTQPGPSQPTYGNQPPTPELPYYMKLQPVWPNDKKRTKIGQGVLYAPEEDVPREPMREYRRGLKAMEKDNIKEAEQHLLRAVELYPKFSSAFNALGFAYQMDPERRDAKTGLNPAAKNAFLQALELNPNNQNALVNLGHLLITENKNVEAERVLRRAIAVHSGSARAYAGLMLAETLQHHFTDVLATAKRIPDGGEDKFPIVFYLRAIAWESKP